MRSDATLEFIMSSCNISSSLYLVILYRFFPSLIPSNQMGCIIHFFAINYVDASSTYHYISCSIGLLIMWILLNECLHNTYLISASLVLTLCKQGVALSESPYYATQDELDTKEMSTY